MIEVPRQIAQLVGVQCIAEANAHPHVSHEHKVDQNARLAQVSPNCEFLLLIIVLLALGDIDFQVLPALFSQHFVWIGIVRLEVVNQRLVNGHLASLHFALVAVQPWQALLATCIYDSDPLEHCDRVVDSCLLH